MKKYCCKVSGGKLVKIRVSFSRGRIKNITILGDFFLHPEIGITYLERDLTGASRQEVLERIEGTIKKHSLQIIGFAPKDLNGLIQRGFDEMENDFQQ